MSEGALPPLKSVAYLVAPRDENTGLVREFTASYISLKRHHPYVQVIVYHNGLTADEMEFFCSLPGVLMQPIGVDSSACFERNQYLEKHGWKFPELQILAAKIDIMLLTPGDTLLLDTDTEVLEPLDDCLRSDIPMMQESEGYILEHERDFSTVLEEINWEAMGWRGDVGRLQVYNSGSVYVPQAYKPHVYKAKEFLWCLAQIPSKARGDNRLDEQLAFSIALQEATGYDLPEIAPRVYHYWKEKYKQEGEWYERIYGGEPLSAVAGEAELADDPTLGIPQP